MLCVICNERKATEVIAVCKSCFKAEKRRANIQRELDHDLTGQDQEVFDNNY